MGNLKGGKLLVLVSTLTLGLSVKVAAEPWNKPIPEPTSESTPQTIKLADQLTKAGAKMFGAHWCPACKEQLRLFGKQAGRELDYVECGMPDKYPLQVQQCSEAEIRDYSNLDKARIKESIRCSVNQQSGEAGMQL